MSNCLHPTRRKNRRVRKEVRMFIARRMKIDPVSCLKAINDLGGRKNCLRVLYARGGHTGIRIPS